MTHAARVPDWHLGGAKLSYRSPRDSNDRGRRSHGLTIATHTADAAIPPARRATGHRWHRARRQRHAPERRDDRVPRRRPAGPADQRKRRQPGVAVDAEFAEALLRLRAL